MFYAKLKGIPENSSTKKRGIHGIVSKFEHEIPKGPFLKGLRLKGPPQKEFLRNLSKTFSSKET